MFLVSVARLRGLPYLADRATRSGELPYLSCKHDQIKVRDYMARRVTPPRWITSPIRGYPTWQTGQPAQEGYPTYHVHMIK